MRGWSNYFKHAVAKHTMSSLENFVWHRVIRTAGDGRTSANTTLAATAAGCDPRRMGSSCSTSPRSRSRDTGVAAPRSPTPGSWPTPLDGRHSGEPVAWKLARRVRASGPEETDRRQHRHRAQGRHNHRHRHTLRSATRRFRPGACAGMAEMAYYRCRSWSGWPDWTAPAGIRTPRRIRGVVI